MVRILVLSREDTSPAGSPLLASSRSFALFSLLAALYLVFALSVPGAFLIARQASVVFSNHVILHAEQSSTEQYAGKAGQEGGEHSWPGPKRLRGALLLPKVGIDKIVNLLLLIAPFGGPKTLLEEDAEGNKLVVADELQPPQDEAFPQELLGRSPPLSR
jgi:hypothetical protein